MWEGNADDLREWLNSVGETNQDQFTIEYDSTEDSAKVVKFSVKTLEGSSYDIPEGYIIIKGIKGEYYPCDPQIFKDSYNETLTHVSNNNV